MRHASVLNPRARDVDYQRRILWVADDKAGQREQRMPGVLAEYLRQFIEDMPADALLFPSKRAKSQASAIFDRCVDRAALGSGI